MHRHHRLTRRPLCTSVASTSTTGFSGSSPMTTTMEHPPSSSPVAYSIYPTSTIVLSFPPPRTILKLPHFLAPVPDGFPVAGALNLCLRVRRRQGLKPPLIHRLFPPCIHTTTSQSLPSLTTSTSSPDSPPYIASVLGMTQAQAELHFTPSLSTLCGSSLRACSGVIGCHTSASEGSKQDVRHDDIGEECQREGFDRGLE